MDPDTSTSIPTDQHQPPVINYVLSFLLVGVAWGFTTPFIRRAAADFNARQDAKRNINRDSVRPGDGDGEEDEDDEGQELLGGEQDRNREDDDVDIDGGEGEGEGDNKSEDSNEQPANENEDSGRRTSPAQAQPQQRPAWLNPPQPRTTWVKNKLITLFWTIINLLRTPAYSIPLVINLTGSIWFFLLVGKHELSLTVPLANSSAFLFTVLGEWYVERKVIAKETWVGLVLVLAGIAVCVQAKNQSG